MFSTGLHIQVGCQNAPFVLPSNRYEEITLFGDTKIGFCTRGHFQKNLPEDTPVEQMEGRVQVSIDEAFRTLSFKIIDKNGLSIRKRNQDGSIIDISTLPFLQIGTETIELSAESNETKEPVVIKIWKAHLFSIAPRSDPHNQVLEENYNAPEFVEKQSSGSEPLEPRIEKMAEEQIDNKENIAPTGVATEGRDDVLVPAERHGGKKLEESLQMNLEPILKETTERIVEVLKEEIKLHPAIVATVIREEDLLSSLQPSPKMSVSKEQEPILQASKPLIGLQDPEEPIHSSEQKQNLEPPAAKKSATVSPLPSAKKPPTVQDKSIHHSFAKPHTRSQSSKKKFYKQSASKKDHSLDDEDEHHNKTSSLANRVSEAPYDNNEIIYNHNNVLMCTDIEQIDFPVDYFKAKRRKTNGKTRGEESSAKKRTRQLAVENECSICYNIFNIKEICGELPKCKHKFCLVCIENWSKRCTYCPMCKADYKFIFKSKCNERIDRILVKPRGLDDEDENADENELIVIEGTDEACYVCKELGDSTTLLVCDHCNFRCCHTGCLPEPIDWVPEEDFYCNECCEKHGLTNKFEKPVPFNAELYQQIREGAEGENNPPPRARRGRPSRANRNLREANEAARERRLSSSISMEEVPSRYTQFDSQRIEDAKQSRAQRLLQRQQIMEHGTINLPQKYKPSPKKRSFPNGRIHWKRLRKIQQNQEYSRNLLTEADFKLHTQNPQDPSLQEQEVPKGQTMEMLLESMVEEHNQNQDSNKPPKAKPTVAAARQRSTFRKEPASSEDEDWECDDIVSSEDLEDDEEDELSDASESDEGRRGRYQRYKERQQNHRERYLGREGQSNYNLREKIYHDGVVGVENKLAYWSSSSRSSSESLQKKPNRNSRKQVTRTPKAARPEFLSNLTTGEAAVPKKAPLNNTRRAAASRALANQEAEAISKRNCKKTNQARSKSISGRISQNVRSEPLIPERPLKAKVASRAEDKVTPARAYPKRRQCKIVDYPFEENYHRAKQSSVPQVDADEPKQSTINNNNKQQMKKKTMNVFGLFEVDDEEYARLTKLNPRQPAEETAAYRHIPDDSSCDEKKAPSKKFARKGKKTQLAGKFSS